MSYLGHYKATFSVLGLAFKPSLRPHVRAEGTRPAWEGSPCLPESWWGREGWGSGLPVRLTRTVGSFPRRCTYSWRARKKARAPQSSSTKVKKMLRLVTVKSVGPERWVYSMVPWDMEGQSPRIPWPLSGASR